MERSDPGIPAYRFIYEDIRKKIIDGTYPTGRRLPSKRTAAADYGVSVITAEHAYALLCDEGYIESRQRSCYFVSYRARDSFPVGGRHKLPPVTEGDDDGGGFPHSVYAKTVRRVLADYEGLLYEKSPTGGLFVLRRAIADYLERSRNITADPGRIFVGSGAEYLYSLMTLILGRDRVFAVESPSYGQILRIYRGSGIECEELRLTPTGIDSAELERSRAEVLHITPYRSYPSRVTASAPKRREYVEWARERGGFLIEDDVESEFAPAPRPTETLYSLAPERVVYLNTFSKTIFPSLRAAYLILPDALMPAYAEKASFLTCTVPSLEQCVIAELIDSGDFERNLNRMRRKRKSAERTAAANRE